MPGELAVGLPVDLDQLEVESFEDRPDRRARHAVAAVEDDLEAADGILVDQLCNRGAEAGAGVDRLHAAASRRPRQPGRDQVADVADAAVAGVEIDLADQLRARVSLGVVGGGADQATVELARADQVVGDLGRELARVEHVRALGDEARAVARRELGRGQAHVVPDATRSCGGPCRRGGQDAGEGPADLLGGVAVDLRAVEAADVVGLEDVGVDGTEAIYELDGPDAAGS